MQANAVRVFRWVEHMLVPEVSSPEFHSVPVVYPPTDEVPETALAMLRFIADHYGQPFLLASLAFNQTMTRQQPKSGDVLNEESDQPTLSPETVEHAGENHEVAASLHGVWLAQRGTLDLELSEHQVCFIGFQVL